MYSKHQDIQTTLNIDRSSYVITSLRKDFCYFVDFDPLVLVVADL